MSAPKLNPLIRLLPSLTDVAFLMPIVFLFGKLDGAKTMLGDGDTGWHIRTGEWILQNGRVPDKDIFSFTKAGEPWFAWEWLWDLLFGWMHLHWGMAPVVLASIFVICLTFALLYRLTRRQCGNVLIAIGVTILAMACSSIHWLARPHLFTLLFVVIFYSILERAREGNTRLLRLLPLLTVLWVNLHGGFFVGLILVLTYAAGELAMWLIDGDEKARHAALARSKPYLLCGLGCFLASFANPYFYQLHVHIYHYLRDPFLYQYVNEFISVSFRHPVALYFEPLISLGVAAVIWNLSRKRFTHAFLVLGWAHLGLMSIRNIPVFAIIAAPIIAVMLQEWLMLLPESGVAQWLRKLLRSAEQSASEIGTIEVAPRWHVVSIIISALVIVILHSPTPSPKFEAKYDPKRYPVNVLQTIRGMNLGRILTEDEWGDYLIYSLYPSVKVFVDGRSDFYGAKFNEEYTDILSAKYDWEDRLHRYQIETVLLSPAIPLVAAMKESSHWRPIYDDGVAIMFRRDGKAYSNSAVTQIAGNT